MRRGLKIAGLGLLALLLAVALALGLLLGTEAGSRWLLARVPGLTVDEFQGRLGGHWQAAALAWRGDDGSHLQVQAPEMAWRPSCLLRATLCIDRLVTPAVTLALPPDQAPSSGPPSLPDLRLPLELELGTVRVERFRLDDQDAFSDLHLSAAWRADGLQIERLGLQRDDLALELSGHISPRGDWPMQARGALTLPAVDGKPWHVALEADGNLRDRVALRADSRGYLAARLEGSLQPLAEHLPAELRLSAEDFKAVETLPDTLRLQGLTLEARGDLEQGYQVQGQANLPGEGGPVALGLQGRVTTQGADIARLELAADAQRRVGLKGRLDWQDGLAADTHLDWQDFPWRRLYPQVDEPPVSVRRLQADLHYAGEAYNGRFQGELQGPAGPFSLASPVSGDLGQVSLDDLRLVAGQGRVQGRLHLGFADAIDWDAALALQDVDPAYWVAELPGRLAGPLNSKGRYADGALALQADLDVQGRLRNQPAGLRLRAAGEDRRWRVDDLLARLGGNRISGSGALDPQLSGRLDIALERLGQLWPGLAGRASGRLDLAGSLDAPQGRLSLDGQGLAQGDLRLQRLAVRGELDARQRGQLQVDARALAAGETALGDLTARLQGDARQQQLDLALNGPSLVLNVGLDGRRDGDAWNGRLARGEVSGAGQTWRLREPAPLRRFADGRVTFGAHCWASGAASLCAGEQRLAPEPQLSYRLRDFPLDSLARWLPPDLAWRGTLSGDLDLALPKAGPQGHVSLDAGPGTLRLKDDQGWVDFPYQRLSLDSHLQPQRVDLQLNFAGGRLGGPTLGALTLEAQIDPRPQDKPLTGRFSLSGLDLAVARPFVPDAETLEGHLDGSGTLGGTLLAPRVDGDLNLRDGRVAGDALPTRLEGLTLNAHIVGEQATLSGGWHAGQGQASVSGNVGWGAAPTVDIALRGTRLPVQVEPYADLEVAPDLRVRLADGRLVLGGQVAIPRGSITVKSLPPQAVRVSGDAQVVGAAPVEQRGPQLAMDVTVVVGEDRLKFSGFGLNADLAGRLQVGDNLTGHGELTLKNGRYRAYGQRLDLKRARLLFTGPLDQPYLDVEAVRQVGDVTAGVRLTGRADGPTTEVFSTPAMSQEQALSYLVLGRPMNSGSDNNALGQAALAMGLSGSAPITGELAQRLGIKDFQLDDEGASGRLSDRLTVRYSLGMQESSSVVAVRYELTKRLYLEAASGLASSLDLFYKRDF
ncbi:translocation/assembly module TamB domain-containing protein [Pseudomonas mangiferae]|uniref:Translocation/assembly module TamB n=1 Tax=Pseudomonas mangiferae TaxID=2593654 RepID=A0A553GVH8_9PSED|nr:translocation/assembly module TamB domain-containing protein [Pseudomonas mangiferae]TRX73514.1 translocation/assembly module TamB [Pseudomonas mangiferae]